MQNGRSYQVLGPLLRATADGDEVAFADLYKLTSRKLFRICVGILPDEAEAHDALQDAYLQVWIKACQYDEARASPITWLATLARNRALDRFRVRKPIPILNFDRESRKVLCEDAGALEVLIERQEHERLELCLRELDARFQDPIRGAFLTGATHREVADNQAVPLGTIKSRVRRGLLILRARLQD